MSVNIDSSCYHLRWTHIPGDKTLCDVASSIYSVLVSCITVIVSDEQRAWKGYEAPTAVLSMRDFPVPAAIWTEFISSNTIRLYNPLNRGSILILNNVKRNRYVSLKLGD